MTKKNYIRYGFSVLLLCLLCSKYTNAAKFIEFTRKYNFQASEKHSKQEARKDASEALRIQLLREVGEYIKAERHITDGEYSENIEGITAGVVKMKIIDEEWNGKEYKMTARMLVDINEVNKQLEKIRQDKDLERKHEEESAKRITAEREKERLRRDIERLEAEMKNYKNNAERAKKQKEYEQTKERYQRYEPELLEPYYAIVPQKGVKKHSSSANEPSNFWFINYNYSPTAPFGMTAGMIASGGAGIYVSAKINILPEVEMVGNSASLYDAVEMDKRKYNRYSIMGGCLLGYKYVFLYAGLGYGKYSVGYRSGNSYYGLIQDERKGLELEIGMMLRIKYITLSCGWNTIHTTAIENEQFEKKPLFSDITLGVGIAF